MSRQKLPLDQLVVPAATPSGYVPTVTGGELVLAAPPAGGGGGGGGSLTDWTALTLASGYVSHADTFGLPPAYRKVGDLVQLRGTLRPSGGGNITANVDLVIATLPAGYRPPAIAGTTKPVVYSASLASSAARARFEVDAATGNVSVRVADTSGWVPLDGIQFSTSATTGESFTGPEGPSAYDVAVADGFTGTEAEWLDSLVGPAGPVDLPPGGLTGQVLTKLSDTDQDADWEDSTSGTGGGGATSLDGLTDVDTSTAPPTAGQALVWDAATSQWIPGAPASSTETITWTDIPLASGYIANSGFGYKPQYRKIGDRVELRGVVAKSGGAALATALTTIATMPTGFRPPSGGGEASAVVYAIVPISGTGQARWQVNGDGTLQLQANGSTTWAPLDGISYSVSATSYTRTSGGGAGGTAASTTSTPTGNIAATNVQDALAELDTEKARRYVTVDDLPTSGIRSAHRGGGWPSAIAPDGSLQAYKTAAALGYHIIDLDYQTARDGALVIMHDTTIDRTTTGTGNVSDYDHHQLPKIDAAKQSGTGWDNEPVPTVDDVLRRFGGRVLLTIEAKAGTSAVAPLAALIKKYGLERSVYINTNDTTVAQAITNAGCMPHVYGPLSTTAAVDAAKAAGAYLVELAYNATTTLVNYALASGIHRVIAGPIESRTQLAAMTTGLQGYVSDGVGYLDRTTGFTSTIARAISAQRVGAGWRRSDSSGLAAGALLKPTALELAQDQFLSLGDMSGSPSSHLPTSYTLTLTAKVTQVTGASASHLDMHFASVHDASIWNGVASDRGGYTLGLRYNGQIVLWKDNADGSSSALLTASTTALTDGQTVTLGVSVTATGITVFRTDTSYTSAVISDTAWRGDYIAVGHSKSTDGTLATKFGLTNLVRS